jgi:hypothetical protein
MKVTSNKIANTILEYYLSLISDLRDPIEKNKRILQTIFNHKLENKVNIMEIANIDDEYKKKLFIQLEYEKRMIRDTFNDHIESINEIMHEFKKRNLEEFPIVLKGISTFGITNNTINIRRSSDIDLIYSDANILEEVLLNLGYSKIETYSNHEHCMMVRNDICIDVHIYVPVLEYSNSMLRKSKNAKSENRKIIFETSPNIMHAVDYYFFLKDSHFNPHINNILIPSLNNHLIIMCANIFRDYVRSLFNFSFNVVISDLIDIIDILNICNINTELLIDNIKQTKSEMSVLFVCYLLDNMFNDNRLKEIIGNNISDLDIFPKILQWSGAIYVPSLDDFFIYFGFNGFIKSLKHHKIQLKDSSSASHLNDFNIYNSHGIPNLSSIYLRNKEDAIEIGVELNNYIKGQTAEVFEIFSENGRCCFSVENDYIKSDENYDGCFWVLNPCGVTITLSKKFINIYGTDENCFALSVTRWGSGPLSTFIPITIQY